MKLLCKRLFSPTVILSLLLLLAGITSLILTNYPTGIRFLLQLTALGCAYLIVLLWMRRLGKGRGWFCVVCKILYWTMVFVLVLLLILFIVAQSHIIPAEKGDAEIPDDVDAVIVLGCLVFGSEPSNMLAHRLDVAYEWLKEHPDCVAVLSGGQGRGEDVSEGQAMATYLEKKGIDPSRLLIESHAANTEDNLKNAAQVLREALPNAQKVIVVTTDFHLYRGVLLAEKEGFETYGRSSDLTGGPIIWLNYHCREFASLVFMHGREFFGG